ncbi:MAG: hypothetical protein ACYCXB_04735, partial [Candidatus Humimicrobiaceae bacterium]
QLKDVYTLFGSELPILYPRMSATLIENKVKKAVSKININYEDLETSQDILAGKILKKMLGFDFPKYLNNLESDMGSVLQKHLDEIRRYDIEEVDAAFGRINQNLKKEIEILGKKVINEYKRKNGLIVESISKIYNNILPGNKLQEREINIFEFINKYGFEIIDNISSDFEVFEFLHKFIEIK